MPKDKVFSIVTDIEFRLHAGKYWGSGPNEKKQ
jgi:hypothetical protein